MIVVDTSVWIDFFNGNSSKVQATIIDLIDRDQVILVYPVFLELLAGARKSDLHKLKYFLSALNVKMVTSECWHQAEKWIEFARGKGQTFAVMDLLIAAISNNHSASIWSLDTDFVGMAKCGFVELFDSKR